MWNWLSIINYDKKKSLPHENKLKLIPKYYNRSEKRKRQKDKENPGTKICQPMFYYSVKQITWLSWSDFFSLEKSVWLSLSLIPNITKTKSLNKIPSHSFILQSSHIYCMLSFPPSLLSSLSPPLWNQNQSHRKSKE